MQTTRRIADKILRRDGKEFYQGGQIKDDNMGFGDQTAQRIYASVHVQTLDIGTRRQIQWCWDINSTSSDKIHRC